MIQCNIKYLENEKNISDLVIKAKKVLKKRKYLYNRYTRKSITGDVKVPLEYYIGNIACGFFGGKSPKYSVKQELNKNKKNLIKNLFNKMVGKNASSEELQILIDYIRDYNDDSSFFYELVKDYLLTGACYGIVYENTDNEIVYTKSPSVQTIAIYDYSNPIQKIGLLRIWQETDEENFDCDMVELILENEKRYYKNSKRLPKEFKEIPDEKEEIKWDLLPFIAIENPDELAIYEPVLSLIDTYEQVIKNNKNIFQYNDEAKLKITGFVPQNEPEIPDPNDETKTIPNPAYIKEIERIKNMDIFFTPDGTGDISWVIKDVNDSASENHKKTLIELILMATCIPNVTDVGFTNADNASALEKKFFPLEQVLIQADKQFKKELLYLWELIISRINKEKKKSYDFREIQIELQRNMPSNKNDIVNMALQLRGLLSDESVINMLPFDLDTESELAKIKKQEESSLNDDLNKSVDIETEENKNQDEDFNENIEE